MQKTSAKHGLLSGGTAFYAAVFFAAFAIMLFSYAVNGVYPFGSGSVLTADLQNQYIDFTAAFFRQLKNGENIFVSWQSGLGSNLYAVMLYIAADPFSLLFLPFDAVCYQEIYLVVICIKIALAALCFCIYIKKSALSGGTDDPRAFALSLCYALCACNIRAAQNPMWLINAAVLPLVLLGIEYTVLEKRPALLYLSAAACFITNYYLAYMSGLFALIYFVYFCTCLKIRPREALSRLFVCAVFAALAAGTAAFVILPSFRAIADGYTDIVGTGLAESPIKYTPDEIIYFFSLIVNGFTASGLPNAYCGTLTLLLFAAYFLNTKIPLPQKISSAAVALIFVASLVFTPLYAVWHIFRAPTGFEGRFLYTAVMFMLILAAKTINNADGIPKKKLGLTAAALFAAVLCCTAGRLDRQLIFTVSAFALMLFVYTALICGKRTKYALCLAVTLEMTAACALAVHTAAVWDGYAPHAAYTKAASEYRDDFAALSAADSAFYRCDFDVKGSYNTALTADFSSTAHYSSLANQKTFAAMHALGAAAFFDNKILLPLGQNVVLDSLFNVKYFCVTDRDGLVTDLTGREYPFNGARLTSPAYKAAAEHGKAVFYRNTCVFPLIFAAKPDILGYAPVSENDPFKNQQAFFDALLSDTQAPLYKELAFTETSALDAVVKTADGALDISPEKEGQPAQYAFIYRAEADSSYFTLLNGDMPDNAVVSEMCGWSVNGVDIPIFRMENELKDLGYFKKGDTILLVFQCNYGCRIYPPPLYMLDSGTFETLSARADENAADGIRLVKGDILAHTDFDTDRLMFCSIACDKGMTVLTDGKKTEKICIADGFLGFYLPAGSHDIKITYTSPGAYPGLALSAVFAVLSALVLKRKIK